MSNINKGKKGGNNTSVVPDEASFTQVRILLFLEIWTDDILVHNQ